MVVATLTVLRTATGPRDVGVVAGPRVGLAPPCSSAARPCLGKETRATESTRGEGARAAPGTSRLKTMGRATGRGAATAPATEALAAVR